MSGEVITVWGTPKVLEPGTAAGITSGALVQATNPYDVVADGASFPDAEFVLTGTFSTAPTEGATFALYAQPLAIDGTANSQTPEVTRATVFIGTFTVDNVTTSQSMPLNGIYAMDVPRKANYFVYNNGAGQMLPSGWKLTVTPRTRKAAP